MPWIDRETALRRAGEGLSEGTCLICHLVENAAVVARGARARVLLPRMGRAEGHLLVALDRHVTSFAAVGDDEWAEASALALRAARALEAALRPARCYVASLGSALGGLPMSSPHLHVHVLPVDDPAARPGRVLSWEDGVFAASEAEAAAILGRVRAAWGAVGSP